LDNYIEWALGRELDLKITGQTTVYFDISGDKYSFTAKLVSDKMIIDGLTLKAGESKNIDANNDGKTDAKVVFREMINGKASVSIINKMV
jgi:hypothetical protein